MSTQIPEGRETFSADSCLPFELSPESQQTGANRWPVIMDINILASRFMAQKGNWIDAAGQGKRN